MFTREDGPTALRADLIHGLSFSARAEQIQTSDGPASAVAGLCAVWNGKSGFVALLIRFLDPPSVDRYVYSESLTSVEKLESITAKAQEFAASLGFRMDAPAFATLDEERRHERLRQWNRIRKPTPLKSTSGTLTSSEENGDGSSAVLAKVSLVRKGGDPRKLEPLGQLLSFF